MNGGAGALTHNPESDIVAWVVGSGIFLIQVCAVIPGLLPLLLLLLPLVLPLVVLGLAGAVLVGLPLAAWRLIGWAVRAVVRRIDPVIPTPETPHA
jgi:hypothetical protein